jgi:Flp pilus assembly protein TadG
MKKQLLRNGRRQRGVAAVEFALVLPILMLLLAVTLFFGRLFWHYTVAQKAAHDAALMLANATRLEIGTSKPDLGDIEISKLAAAVAAEEIAELNPGVGRPRVEVYCDQAACVGDAVPNQVRVLIRMRMYDIFLGGFSDNIGGNEGIWLHADVRVPYVGH